MVPFALAKPLMVPIMLAMAFIQLPGLYQPNEVPQVESKTGTSKMEFPEPNWKPLEETIPQKELNRFMFMGMKQRDGVRLWHYKHDMTRNYIVIDDSGQTYQYTGITYLPVPKDFAIKEVFR